jgi:hypothetical protein
MNPSSAKIEAPPVAALAPMVVDPAVSGFMSVVDRLQGVIDFETDSLSRHVAIDLAELNRQKRQGMLELTRLMRGFGTRPASDAVRERLVELGTALDRNRAVLDVQLGAMREIAEIIAQVMKDAEWDGTYSMRASWK